MKRSRFLVLSVAILLFVFIIAGCAQQGTTTNTSGTTQATTTAKPTETTQGPPTKISYFRGQPNYKALTDWKKALWVQTIEKKMNVEFDFQGPPASDDYNAAAQIMLNSGTLTDLFFYNFNNYNGGLAAAIEDGIVVKVSDNADYKAMMPNWFGLLGANENVRRSVTLDDGSSSLFCHIDLNLKRGAYWGLGIREDWLAKVGKTAPTSMDELYEVLKAFKTGDPNGNNKADEIPFTDWNLAGGLFFFSTMDLISPFGILYQEQQLNPTNDKKIEYWITVNDGANFQTMVTTLNKWYSEGLIDPEAYTQDGAAQDAKVTGDLVGCLHVWPSNFNVYNTALRKTNPNAKFVGLPALKGPDGIAYGPNAAMVRPAASTEGTVITTQAEKDGKMEICLKLIDFMVSDEGSTIQAWGVEGDTYTVDSNGKKMWTDKVAKNPDMLINDAVNAFALPTFGGWPKQFSYEGWASIELNTPESAAAHDLWGKADMRLCLPNLTLSSSEATEYAKIMTDVKTAISESFVKLVTGQLPVTDVPNLVARCRELGIDKANALYQACYDRYLKK
jgi:putative aldouronate transport system substrate-binding protein